MKTAALIERLSDAAAPLRAHAALRALALGIGAGVAVSFALMWLWLGIRPDLADATGASAYWMKFFYTLLFAGAGFWTVERLARPGAGSRLQMILEALPFAALAALALVELAISPAPERMALVMGHSSRVCPWRIAVLSLPILAGALGRFVYVRMYPKGGP